MQASLRERSSLCEVGQASEDARPSLNLRPKTLDPSKLTSFPRKRESILPCLENGRRVWIKMDSRFRGNDARWQSQGFIS
jgi:hypothetical protein